MNARILIVDDSGFARRSLRQVLEGAGHSVDEAKDGLDMVMEGMNGLEVLAKLRELDKEAKVLVATADIQASTKAEAQAGGASGFITKPFDREQVVKAVSTVLTGGMSWN